MSEHSLGTAEVINTTSLVDNLTYVSCEGRAVAEITQIAHLWSEAIELCSKKIAEEGNLSSLLVRTNQYGSTHIVERNESRLSGAELFFKACDSIVFGSRHSNVGVKVVENGKVKKELRYSVLERGVDEGDEIRSSQLNTEIEYRNKGQSLGTRLVVEGNKMQVFQRMSGEKGGNNGPMNGPEVLVFELEADSKEKQTRMTFFCIDTKTSSRVEITSDSSKAFWIMRNGLLFGNEYPHPDSIRSFKKQVAEVSLPSNDKDAL